MPELPEVERVRRDIDEAAVGRTISQVDTTIDEIVFDGVKSDDFEKTLVGRRVLTSERRGKNFFLTLDGKGSLPVMHLGMTGRINVLGQKGLRYQDGKEDDTVWPPKYMKFVLHLTDPDKGDVVQIAFSDPRRLGRIRLRADPVNEPPLSLLGPDPIVSPPTAEVWHAALTKRRSPIKSVLLDQAVCAGVGNWVADEILFHAGLHPLTVASSLSDAEIELVRKKMLYVCQTAVGVGADSSQFPPGWLMRHRWGKGKKKGEGEPFVLADGTPAVVEFVTVGGRTSAFVDAVQPKPSASSSSGSRTKATSPKPRSSSKSKAAVKLDNVSVVAPDMKARRSLSTSLSPPPALPKALSQTGRAQRRTRKRPDVGSDVKDEAAVKDDASLQKRSQKRSRR